MKRITMNRPSDARWLMVGAAVFGAAGLGFGIAKLTAPEAAPAAAERPAAAPDTLAMGADRITASGVEVQAVTNGGLASEIVSQATVSAEPSGEAVLTARAGGSVSRILKRLGDPVIAGEPVALVESREAAQMAAARTTAVAKADLARKIYARERKLFEEKVSPRQDMERAQAELAAAEAEARGASISARAADVSSDGRYVVVSSPIGGRITAMSASLGAYVQPETELFRISDPSKVQVEAAVTATDAARLQPGDAAVVETSAGEALKAAVRAITPGVSADTRSATVVLTLTGANTVLQPGQLVRAHITAGRTTGSGIVVPEEALQTVDGRDAVFVRTPKGFRAQAVTIGQRAAGRAEVVSGLKSGDVIAVKNAFLLKAELGKSGEDED